MLLFAACVTQDFGTSFINRAGALMQCETPDSPIQISSTQSKQQYKIVRFENLKPEKSKNNNEQLNDNN